MKGYIKSNHQSFFDTSELYKKVLDGGEILSDFKN